MPGTEHPFRRGGKGGGENVAPQRHRVAGFAAVVEGGKRCNMRHRVYSKDAAERTVPQRQENTGKAAVVGRWAERELVKDEKRRDEKRKRGRKKEGRKREKSEEKERKRERKKKRRARRKRGNTRKETARTTGKITGASGIVLPLGDVGSRKGRGPTKWGGSPRGNTISGA